ncbi:MAG TPA: cytochrome c oxidase subunit II [Acidimicrobiales bacterium]|nr:cytochrome c oxidase subunit II [Acidimicrobiales bacterium]
MRLRRPFHRAGAAVCCLALLGAGCAADTPQNTLDPEGPFARSVDNLIQPVFWIAAAVFVFVEGLIVYAVFKFRRRSEDDRPEQIHGSTKFELAWTIVPALILVVVGVLTVSKIFYLDRQFEDAMQVEVIGHQWWWEYNYKDAQGETVVAAANELHIPVGRKVQLNLTSADVIHNYWPPKLAGKVYAIPGRRNHMTIQADKADFYYGECAEYCGLSHANMRLRVVAEEPATFERWMEANSIDRPATSFPIVASADQATASEEAKGHTLFLQKGCSGCHAVNAVSRGAVGPNLTYFNSRATFAGAIFGNDDDNLRAWLRDPPAEKPGSLMPKLDLSEGEITSLIAYLRTLGDPALRGAPVPAGLAAGPPQP